jgi:Kef-type K+ transport system membrane component KefB
MIAGGKAMLQVWFLASLWVLCAVLAVALARWWKVSTALVEIVVGIFAQWALLRAHQPDGLAPATPWVTWLAGAGAIVLTFLAGAELDPDVFRAKWKEALAVGMVGFLAPFLGCAAIARYVLHWSVQSSWLAGVALSTTSVAVVYAVLLELGLNRTEFGKAILASCFVNDLGTVVALGLLFAPFTYRTLIFVLAGAAVIAALPRVVPPLFARYGNHASEMEVKLLALVLFGLGALAAWAGSEPVLPAYLVGMVLAGSVGRDHQFIRRLRTLTLGLLTPFYFLRAGSFVSLPALIGGPLIFLALFGGKMVSKLAGLVPAVRRHGYRSREGLYYVLMMSTGLTFGTISSLYGLSHGLITRAQYSFLVAAVIGSAVVPTLIANAWVLPHHLLPEAEDELEEGEDLLPAARNGRMRQAGAKE